MKDLTPKAVRKSARRSFIQKCKDHAKGKADGKSTSKSTSKKASGGASGLQTTKPWCGQVEWAAVPDHQLVDKEVQVVGGGAAPEYLGKCGPVKLVQLRKCVNTGTQAYQVSVAITKTKVLHLEASDVQQVAPGAGSAPMIPYRLNYQGFDKALPEVRAALNQGKEAEHLEPAVLGQLLESGLLQLGQIELRRCRREQRGSPARLRAQDFLKMAASLFVNRLCYGNHHFDVETCLRGGPPLVRGSRVVNKPRPSGRGRLTLG